MLKLPNMYLYTHKLVIFPSDAIFERSAYQGVWLCEAVDYKDNDFEGKIEDAETRSFLFYNII